MKDYTLGDIALAILISYLFGIATFMFFSAVGKDLNPPDKLRAVQAGHAEYYLDEKHNRQWRWLPTPPPTK